MHIKLFMPLAQPQLTLLPSTFPHPPQADRDSSLQELGRLLAPAVFGTPRQHGLPAADGGLLSDTGACAGLTVLVLRSRACSAGARIERAGLILLVPRLSALPGTHPASASALPEPRASPSAAVPTAAPPAPLPTHHFAVEMLISEYRPLFTQPFNLRRYEADAARQAAAEAARAEAAGMPSSPLLTPIRCERLSVMVPEGLGSPFGDCCATPLAAESPVSAFLAAAIEQAAGAGPSPSQPAAAAQPGYTSVAVVPLVGGSPRGLSALQTAPPPAPHSPLGAHRYHPLEADALLEETFSSLLESTVSGMLFGGDLLAAEAAQAAPAPTAALGLTCSAGCRPLSAGSGLAGEDADMQPASPVAVLPEPASDGGDTSDGSGGLRVGSEALGRALHAGWVAALGARLGGPAWRAWVPAQKNARARTAQPQRTAALPSPHLTAAHPPLPMQTAIQCQLARAPLPGSAPPLPAWPCAEHLPQQPRAAHPNAAARGPFRCRRCGPRPLARRLHFGGALSPNPTVCLDALPKRTAFVLHVHSWLARRAWPAGRLPLAHCTSISTHYQSPRVRPISFHFGRLWAICISRPHPPPPPPDSGLIAF